MLPAKVRDAIRGLLILRVNRMIRLLRDSRSPDNAIANEARLIGDAGAMLDPDILAGIWVQHREREARRYARVCVWDGECEADATSDDGLCAAHAAEQTSEAEADERADIDAHVARIVAENEAS